MPHVPASKEGRVVNICPLPPWSPLTPLTAMPIGFHFGLRPSPALRQGPYHIQDIKPLVCSSNHWEHCFLLATVIDSGTNQGPTWSSGWMAGVLQKLLEKRFSLSHWPWGSGDINLQLPGHHEKRTQGCWGDNMVPVQGGKNQETGRHGPGDTIKSRNPPCLKPDLAPRRFSHINQSVPFLVKACLRSPVLLETKMS